MMADTIPDKALVTRLREAGDEIHSLRTRIEQLVIERDAAVRERDALREQVVELLRAMQDEGMDVSDEQIDAAIAGSGP